MTDYKDKDYADCGPPDGFDIEQDPVYQRFMSKQAQNRIRQEIKEVMNNDDDQENEGIAETAYGA